MAREITLLLHKKAKAEIDGIMTDCFETIPAILGPETKELRVKGAIGYEIINTGDVQVKLWDSVYLRPGQSYQPAKYDLLPIATNIKLLFDDDNASNRGAGPGVNPFTAAGDGLPARV